MNRAKELWRILNLPCEGMARLASESLDRDLSRLERFPLRLHLIYCAACRRYLRQLRVLRDVMRRLATSLETGEPLPGPSLPREVRERIQDALRKN